MSTTDVTLAAIREQFAADGGNTAGWMDLDTQRAHAMGDAIRLRTYGLTARALEVGNGTRYSLVIVDLKRHLHTRLMTGWIGGHLVVTSVEGGGRPLVLAQPGLVHPVYLVERDWRMGDAVVVAEYLTLLTEELSALDHAAQIAVRDHAEGEPSDG